MTCRGLFVHSLLAAVAICLAVAGRGHAAGPPRPPNIVIILADDLGYGDLGCYGATRIKTPHIDGLAREGMRFTDAHAPASVCSPSRYGLVTGRFPWRLRQKGNDYRLEPGRLTLAKLLAARGYRTAAIGKWHLGYGDDWNRPPITGPLEAGFDYHFGVPWNHNDPFRVFIENHDIVGRRPGEPFRVVPNDLPQGVAEPRPGTRRARGRDRGHARGTGNRGGDPAHRHERQWRRRGRLQGHEGCEAESRSRGGGRAGEGRAARPPSSRATRATTPSSSDPAGGN